MSLISGQINPSRRKVDHRKVQREYDKKRNRIERTFNKLKRFRRIATRYDRKALYFSSFVYLAASLLWL